MPRKSWEHPIYIPDLVGSLENDFGITPYQYKSSTAQVLTSFFRIFSG